MEAAAEFDVIIVAGHHAAALSRIQVFGGLETKAAEIADSAEFLVAPLAQMSLAGILDDRQAMLPRGRLDRVQIGRRTAYMYRHDRASARSDRGFHLPGVDLESLGIRVNENRQRVLQQHSVDR